MDINYFDHCLGNAALILSNYTGICSANQKRLYSLLYYSRAEWAICIHTYSMHLLIEMAVRGATGRKNAFEADTDQEIH